MSKKDKTVVALDAVPTITATPYHQQIAELKKALAAIEKNKSEKDYKTSGNIQSPGTSPVNIKSVTDINMLVNLLSGVEIAAAAQNQTAERLSKKLGLKIDRYKRNGHTVEEWQHDVELRIHILSIEGIREKLKGRITEMEKYLSLDEHRQKESKETQKILDELSAKPGFLLEAVTEAPTE